VGFISPGVLAIFLMGFFWQRTTTKAALLGTWLTIPISVVLKFLPYLSGGLLPEYPFLDRMTITFVVIIIIMVIASLLHKEAAKERIIIERSMFRVSSGFQIGSLIICCILLALYTAFW
jgi:SSS family solute:Na+ symporter